MFLVIFLVIASQTIYLLKNSSSLVFFVFICLFTFTPTHLESYLLSLLISWVDKVNKVLIFIVFSAHPLTFLGIYCGIDFKNMKFYWFWSASDKFFEESSWLRLHRLEGQMGCFPCFDSREEEKLNTQEERDDLKEVYPSIPSNISKLSSG